MATALHVLVIALAVIGGLAVFAVLCAGIAMAIASYRFRRSGIGFYDEMQGR